MCKLCTPGSDFRFRTSIISGLVHGQTGSATCTTFRTSFAGVQAGACLRVNLSYGTFCRAHILN